MKKSIIKISLLMFFLVLVLLSTKSFAGTQTLNSWNFDVTLNTDGSMNVVETWDVYASNTNTLFKTFEYDSKLFEDVLVEDITTGVSQKYEKINQLQYHVTPGCYYGLKNSEGNFEIAWNIGADNTSKTKKYRISYTVKDLVRVYNDCSEMYWQFVGKDFEIPSKNVKGTIKLPNAVANIEDLRVWAHGPLIGEIKKISSDTVEFEISKLDSRTMLEVRIAAPSGIFETAINRINTNKLDSIISEETVWADDANNQRLAAQRALQTEKTISYVVTTVFCVIFGFLIAKAIITIKENPKIVPTQKLDYFRDLPNEEATPADAEFMRKLGKGFNTGNVISATFLDLSLKGGIDFESNGDNKKDVSIIFNPNFRDVLPEEEKAIYNFLKKAAGERRGISMKEFEKYCRIHDSSAYNLWQSIFSIAKGRNTSDKEKFDRKIHTKSLFYTFSSAMILTVVLPIILMFWAVFETVIYILPLVIIELVLSVIAASRLNGYTQKSIDEKEKWNGLKKYMEDFSLLDEKSVPELILWEQYLVYATAFGISEKVLKQLKVVFPELQNDEYFRNNYAAIYYCNNYNISRSFERSIQDGYNAHASEIASSSMSSGSGGGGGFSSGGGGRIWRRRPEEEDKNEITRV